MLVFCLQNMQNTCQRLGIACAAGIFLVIDNLLTNIEKITSSGPFLCIKAAPPHQNSRMAQILLLSFNDVIEKRYLNWRALWISSHLLKNFQIKMIYSLAITVLIALFNSAHCARNSPPSTALRERSDFSIFFFWLS